MAEKQVIRCVCHMCERERLDASEIWPSEFICPQCWSMPSTDPLPVREIVCSSCGAHGLGPDKDWPAQSCCPACWESIVKTAREGLSQERPTREQMRRFMIAFWEEFGDG